MPTTKTPPRPDADRPSDGDPPMPTKTSTTPVETDHAATIADLDAQIADLTPQWARYRNVQPVAPAGLVAAPIDPTKLVRKYRIGIALDKLNIARENLLADRARTALAALADVDPDALAAARDAALDRVLAARAVLTEAEGAHRTAAHAAHAHVDRVRECEGRLRDAEAAATRWRKELDRDRTLMATYEDAAKHAAA